MKISKPELERLKAENEQLKPARAQRQPQVREKAASRCTGSAGFLSPYYKEQWTKLLSMADEIRTFIKENEPNLKAKPE